MSSILHRQVEHDGVLVACLNLFVTAAMRQPLGPQILSRLSHSVALGTTRTQSWREPDHTCLKRRAPSDFLLKAGTTVRDLLCSCTTQVSLRNDGQLLAVMHSAPAGF